MKAKAAQLLDKALDVLEAAEILHRAGKEDSAAGRAYYAMFYVAEAVLYERDLEFSKHAGVHAAFGEHIAKTSEMDPKFHRWLLDAFRVRLTGDYTVDASIGAGDVDEMIKRSQEFLIAARAYLSCNTDVHHLSLDHS